MFNQFHLLAFYAVVFAMFATYFKLAKKQGIIDNFVDIGIITAYFISLFLIILLISSVKLSIPNSDISINYILIVPIILTSKQFLLKVVNLGDDTQK
jgi:hypothetical protein